jgi:rhamnosyltransferase
MNVSILIPTYNGMETLPALLDALQAWRKEGVEIVIAESGSTDGTAEYISTRVDKVVPVQPGTFNHGETRNAGIDACSGDLVVLTVQDALPMDRFWLSALTGPFSNPNIAGTYARQLPRADASALTRHFLEQWMASSPDPRLQTLDAAQTFDRLTPMDRYRACVFDNVCSCIRKSVWRKIPFRSTPIGEDIEWAKEVLLAGHTLAYVPEARVVHSHDRSARYEFWRTYLVHQRLSLLFGLTTLPDVPSLGRAVASSLQAHWRCVAEQTHSPLQRVKETPRALALAVAWPLGQYLGALSHRNPRLKFRPKGV